MVPGLPNGNPKIPEGINFKAEHPLKEFAQLFLGVCAGLVVLTVVLSVSLEFLAPYIPFSWEKKAAPVIGQYLAGEDSASEVSPNAKLAMQRLGERLLLSSAQGKPGADIVAHDIQSSDFTFHLIHSDVPNAYASLGGHIVVTDALLDKVSSENGLAMVIAHEIAHIRGRHPIQAASRGIVLQLLLYGVLGSAAEGVLGNVLSSSGVLTLLSFNRDMELEADDGALDILQRHYGTYAGADEFFQNMAHEGDSVLWLEFAQTHPNTDRRLAAIRARFLNPHVKDSALTPMPAALRRAN